MSRKFGEVPEWAKAGPIDHKNYDYRVEQHCVLKNPTRHGQHPTITKGSPEYAIWREYFDYHLGGRPWAFAALTDGKIGVMTVPEQLPQHFDPSFTPTGGHKP